MFDRELDYYGITSTTGITDQGSLVKTVASFTGPYRQAKSKHDVFSLALEGHYQYSRCQFEHGSADSVTVNIDAGKDRRLYDIVQNMSSEEWKLLDEYLERYFGLKFRPHSATKDGYLFYVSLIK